MDRFTVTKPFNTHTRRLAVGASVTAEDLVDDIMPLADRRSRRFLVGEDTKAAERAVEKAADADEPIVAHVEPPVAAAPDEPADERRKR